MTASRAELERLTPEDVALYLRSAGWRPAGDLNGRATIWALEHEQMEVIVPVSTRLRDYIQRINEVIRTLAITEARSEPEIIRSITDAYTDRQYFRSFPDAPSGMIPAADAAKAFQGVRELLIAAAHAEHSPGAEFVLPNRQPKIVKEFPERTLLTTAPGSFVIATHVQLPSDGETLFSSPDSSFERRAILRLRQAVLGAQAAATAAHHFAELTPFAKLPNGGISKTVCRALASFGGTNHDRAFEVRFTWASAVPADVPDTLVRFEAEQVTMLGRAAEELHRRPETDRIKERREIQMLRRSRPETERAEISGKIQAMERSNPDDRGWVAVRGTLQAADGGRNRRVWVPLNPEDYDRALRAHAQGLEVRIAGILTRTGRRAELEPTEYFRVI
jgi:hypothetical protein